MPTPAGFGMATMATTVSVRRKETMMRVDLVSTYWGRHLHIRDDKSWFYTLCGARPDSLIWPRYELTDAEPDIAGLHGICKTCRKVAEQEQPMSDTVSEVSAHKERTCETCYYLSARDYCALNGAIIHDMGSACPHWTPKEAADAER